MPPDSFKFPASSLILVASNEPLLIRDWLDQARKSMRESGIEDIQTSGGDGAIDWMSIVEDGDSMSLFADQKCRIIYINTGKPGQQGSKVIQQLCDDPPELTRFIFVLPSLDRATKNAAWFKKFQSCGNCIELPTIYPNQLSEWIVQRAARHSIVMDFQAAAFLAERTEGNLLAADQEIQKLSIRFPGGKSIDLQTIEESTSQSARYSHFVLVDSCLSGKVKRAFRVLEGLLTEGFSTVQIRWAIQSSLEQLVALKRAQTGGQLNDRTWQALGIWQSKQRLYQNALSRLKLDQVEALLQSCARLDRVGKGQEDADFESADWLQLKALVSDFCGLQSSLSR